jgi:MFS family permease
MASSATTSAWLESIKSTWGTLAGFGVFIFGIVGSFVLPPPGWVSSAGDKPLVNLAQFVVSVLAGLILIFVHKWQRKKDLKRWALIAIGSLALSLAAYFSYQHFLDTRTCEYFEHSVVIGSAYTQQAQDYVRETVNTSCSMLLADFAGRPEDIWTQQSINRSRYILALSYITIMPLLTVCVIAVVQALYCATLSRRGRVKTTGKTKKKR